MERNGLGCRRAGLNTGLLWLSALKPTTRTWHASRHGKVYTTEQVRDYAENGNKYNCYCANSLPADR
jgi:uncharacterized protein with gpF-like domain